MSNHVTTKLLDNGKWAVISKSNGSILEIHETEYLATRAFATDKTKEEKQARFGFYDKLSADISYENELIYRFKNNLPLSRCDKKLAKKLIKASPE
jgi:hypothetical protein